MFDKNIRIQDGNNNQQANRDINNYGLTQEQLTQALSNALNSNDTQKTNGILFKALSECEEWIYRNHLEKAKSIFDCISIHCIESGNAEILQEIHHIETLLAYKLESIIVAKEKALGYLKIYPSNAKVLFLLCDICDLAPQDGDELENHQEKLCNLMDKDSPEIKLHTFYKEFKNGRHISKNEIPSKWDYSPRMNAIFIRLYALSAHESNLKHERDNLIISYKKELPFSPKPFLLEMRFKNDDVLSNKVSTPLEKLQENLEFSKTQKNTISSKDPFTKIDKILWEFEELRILIAMVAQYDLDKEISIEANHKLQRMLTLIDECFFDIILDNTCQNLLSNFHLSENDLKILYNKLIQSKILLSQITINYFFFNTLAYPNLFEVVLFVWTKKWQS